MIKLINIITQNIILLGCCAISIFILIDSTLICDYCIIPEADYILKEDTSFLTKVLAQV